jgi:hypothetical protein
MRFWDTTKDKEFDEALDEMIRAQRQEPTDADIEDMYQDYITRHNISNKTILIGAQ